MYEKFIDHLYHKYYGMGDNPHGLAKIIIRKLSDDKEFVLELVKKCPCYLELVSDRLKNDKDVVKYAVRVNDFAFDYASKELKSDEKFCYSLLQYGFNVYRNLSTELKNKRNFVIESAKHGCGLDCFPEHFRADKEIVLEVYNRELSRKRSECSFSVATLEDVCSYWDSSITHFYTTDDLKKEISNDLLQALWLSRDEIKPKDIDKSLISYDFYVKLLKEAWALKLNRKKQDKIKEMDKKQENNNKIFEQFISYVKTDSGDTDKFETAVKE